MNAVAPNVVLLNGKPESDFARYAVMASNIIVKTADGRLCLQRRDIGPWAAPGALAFWGGMVEAGESFDDALLRELEEELGVTPPLADIVFLGAFERTRDDGSMTCACFYFWHDVQDSVQNCYEGAREYLDTAAALADPTLHTPGTKWSIEEAMLRGFI